MITNATDTCPQHAPALPPFPLVQLMLDIETAGKYPGCPVLQIGAVTVVAPRTCYTFGLYFYGNASLCSNIADGLTPEEDTMEWWKTQDPTIYEAVFSSGVLIRNLLQDFATFCAKHGPNLQVWCCGTDFDISILSHAYRKLGIAIPWKYNAIRDYRTIREQFPPPANLLSEVAPNTTKHDALADAIYQTNVLLATNAYVERVSNGALRVL